MAAAVSEERKERRKKDDSIFFRSLTSKLKRFRTVTYDLESKDGASQDKGFTRLFLGWIYDGEEHWCYEQPAHLNWIIWKNCPWLEEGGIIDRMMRHFLGLDLCGVCEVWNERALNDPEVKLKLCPECKKKRERYQSKVARIYAHNAGRFDALFIVPWLLRHAERFEFEISGPESRIQRLVVWPRGKDRKRISWTFLDSVSILPMSLKAAGETFCGIKERKIEMDLDLPEGDPLWKAYNKRDCETLYKAIESLNTQVVALGGEVGITAPSTAMSLFRRRFLKIAVYRNKHFAGCKGHKVDKNGVPILDEDGELVPCNACAHDFVREGYYGGRTEMFAETGRDIRYYDLNSSYPRAMKDPMPVGKMTEVGPVQDETVYLNLRKKRIGFVECEVEIPETCEIPPLPVRVGDKLKFPASEAGKVLRGVWEWDELQLLKHPRVNGRVVRYIRSVWYEQKPIFREMIDTLYGLRLAAKASGDKGMDFLTKLLMNSCYGKLGMRVERGSLVVHRIGDVPPANGRPLGHPDETGVWEVERVIDAPYVVPQIAAKVTSNARIRLFLGMMSVLDQGEVTLKDGRTYLGYLHVDGVEGVEGGSAPYEPRYNRQAGTRIRIRTPIEDKGGDKKGAAKYIDYVVEWSEIAKIERGEILYVDTDSIMCCHAVVQPEGKELGEWKREYPHVLLDGQFVLPKLYQLRFHDARCTGTGPDGKVVFPDPECPGCKWEVEMHDLENDKKFETWITRLQDEVDVDFKSMWQSAGNMRAKIKPPSLEKMKGVPGRMANAKQFKRMIPKSKGGQGLPVYVDKEMITQHRTMLRDGLEGPRVYEGIPGDPKRLEGISMHLVGDADLREEIEKALASGKPVLVERVASRLVRRGLGTVAEELRESERYRARFKQVRTDYDKRLLVGGGKTRPLLVEVGANGENVLSERQLVPAEPFAAPA